MSASLVGSEMCIRDSVKCACSTAYAAGDSAAEELAILRLKWWATQSPLTVSYTHLTLPTICSV
eukprot:6149433-Alexandrium_andersonii.AAC.1